MRNIELMTLAFLLGAGVVVVGIIIMVASGKELVKDRQEKHVKKFEPIGFTIENDDGSMGFSHMKIVLHKPLLLDLKKGGYVESCTIELSEKFEGDYCILVRMPEDGGTLPINKCTFPVLPEGVQAWKVIFENNK